MHNFANFKFGFKLTRTVVRFKAQSAERLECSSFGSTVYSMWTEYVREFGMCKKTPTVIFLETENRLEIETTLK